MLLALMDDASYGVVSESHEAQATDCFMSWDLLERADLLLQHEIMLCLSKVPSKLMSKVSGRNLHCKEIATIFLAKFLLV